MEEIVKNLLPENGYPELNLGNADKILTSDREGVYELIKDYKLTGDHNGKLGDDNLSFAYDSDNIQNLSNTVIGTWGGNIETDTESLQYLFDPSISNPYKTSHTDVTGLF